MSEIETDYLVVGAGAAGLAFVDALIADSDADVVFVDRRHSAGGHWNDAYPFVRLHQPSATYGVASVPLGDDRIDTVGPNAGFYERATGVEVCEYLWRVLDDHLLPSGQVRFVGGCDYVGDWSTQHAVTSRLTGASTTVRVRRKVVDGTYLDASVPATHTPGFTADPAAHVIPVGDLARLAGAPSGFTVLGAGKTAMDACTWLLDNGVDADRIRWVRPRDAWLNDRAAFQPRDLVVNTMESLAATAEAMAEADDLPDLFRRLEACGELHRLDSSVEPTMYRGAILSAGERDQLRTVERVVRLGRVQHIASDRIVLEQGEVATAPGEVHVDCTASGFSRVPPRPIFEPHRITIQSLQGGFTTANAAVLGHVEAARDDDREKNRLCEPNPGPSRAEDWLPMMADAFRSSTVLSAEPDIRAWYDRCRLNLTHGLLDHMGEPAVQAAVGRWITHLEPALVNADRLRSATG